MALRFDDKKALVAEVATVAQSALSVVAAEYRGLPVAKLTELRAKARANRVYVRVVKNTLARRAIAGTQFECVGAKLKGPLILAFSQDDPGAAARLINAEPSDVALIPSISYGVATAGKILTIPRGTRVLVLEDDHSSPVLEWHSRADAQGFAVETIKRPDDGDWTSAVLAAIMLKLGAYGFIRFSLPILPDASHSGMVNVLSLSLLISSPRRR